MNRRRFLSALGLGLAALHLRLAPRIELPPSSSPLVIDWIETTRVSYCTSKAYTEAIAAILGGQPNDFLKQLKKSGFGA